MGPLNILLCRQSPSRNLTSKNLHKPPTILSVLQINSIFQTLPNTSLFSSRRSEPRVADLSPITKLSVTDRSPSPPYTKPTRTSPFGLALADFPASTQLYLDSPISQALVCRTTWDDPVVQAQANVVLGVDQERASRTINRHRFEALRAFKRVYKMMKTTEGLYYGADSFLK